MVVFTTDDAPHFFNYVLLKKQATNEKLLREALHAEGGFLITTELLEWSLGWTGLIAHCRNPHAIRIGFASKEAAVPFKLKWL